MTPLPWLRCEHPRLSRVFTIDGRTYQVCLECGAEIAYDLEIMRPAGELAKPPVSHPDYVHIARQHKRRLERSTAR